MMFYRMLMSKTGLIYSHILLIAIVVYVPGQVPVANDPPVIDFTLMGWNLIFLVLIYKAPSCKIQIYTYKIIWVGESI